MSKYSTLCQNQILGIISPHLSGQAYPLKVPITSSSKKSVSVFTDAKRRPQRKLVKETIKMNPFQDIIQTACSALNNNALRITETKGSDSSVKVQYPPELLQGLRGLFRAGHEYTFRIHASGNWATSGGGVFAPQTADWSPAVTTFSEWTALAALFDECKLKRSTLSLTSAFGPTSTAIVFQVAVAPEFGPALATTFTPISRLAESQYLHPVLDFRTKRIRARVPPRDWATTGTPAGASGMIAGCLGRFVAASNIVGTVSINYLFWALENDVAFRMRA